MTRDARGEKKNPPVKRLGGVLMAPTLQEKEANVGTRMSGEIKIEPITRPLCREKSFDACRLASLQRSDTYLSVYLRPDGRFRCDKGIRALLTDTRVPREKRNANSLSRNNTTYLVSRVTSCNLLTEAKATQGNREKKFHHANFFDIITFVSLSL